MNEVLEKLQAISETCQAYNRAADLTSSDGQVAAGVAWQVHLLAELVAELVREN